MADNNRRREATRRQLEQQLRDRQAREARRKRTVLISSVVSTVLVVALVVVLVVVLINNSDDKTNDTASKPGRTTTPTSTATSPAPTSSAPAVQLAAPVACAKPTGKASTTFDGVTVGSATDLKHQPKVRSTAKTDPKALTCADLVVGKGAAATPTSSVTVQYTGVLYKNGTEFDSSWARGMSAQFSLTMVVPGFTQGIGGTGKVAPMHVGSRRIMILPAALGYGSAAQQGIPANSSLVFVVDLLKVG